MNTEPSPIRPDLATPYLDLGYVPCREAWVKPSKPVQPQPAKRPQVLEDIRLATLGVRP